MGKIIDFDNYRAKLDQDIFVDITNNNHRKIKLQEQESRKFKSAFGLSNLGFCAMGVVSVVGEFICSINLTNYIISENFKLDTFLDSAGVLWFLVFPSLFLAFKKEILDSFKKLFYKFKELNKPITDEETRMVYEDLIAINLEELEEKEKLRRMGFTDLNNPYIRDFLDNEDKPRRR